MQLFPVCIEWYIGVPGDEQPLAYALFAPCFTCAKDLKAVVNISRALSSKRITVLRFTFKGCFSEFFDQGERMTSLPRSGLPFCMGSSLFF
jgi:hypothetical protein